MRSAIILIFFLLPTFLPILFKQSGAQAHVVTVTGGVSNSESDTNGNTTIIYGAVAGVACAGDNVTTCNSCTSATTAGTSCSRARIYPSLVFNVNLRLEAAVPINTKYALLIDSSGGGLNTVKETSTTTALNIGDPLSFKFTWGEFCTNFSGDLGTDCGSSSEKYFQKNIYIGVDSNANSTIEESERKAVSVRIHTAPVGTTNTTDWCPDVSSATSSTGACQAKLAAGDSKVYVLDGEWTLGGASYVGAPLDAVAIFPISATLGNESNVYSSFTYDQASPRILKLNANNELNPDQITGLENGVYYCFVLGAIDKAQVLYSLTTGGTIPVTDICTSPSEVVGLLEDKHCFISTAAFGSPLAKEVEVFRQFRNEYLLNNSLGISFVKAYYKYSPPLAEFISQNEELRTLARILLYPVLVFSFLSLKLGLVITSLILFSLMALLMKLKRSAA